MLLAWYAHPQPKPRLRAHRLVRASGRAAAGAAQPAGTMAPFARNDKTILEIALPVLNGMVYTAEVHGKAVLTRDGLAALLPLLCEAVPIELHEQVAHVLFNATSIKEPTLLAAACRGGVVQSMQTAAAIAQRHGSVEALSLAYGSLGNLTEGCADARALFVQSTEAMELLLGLCDRTPTASNEVRCAAAEVLLTISAAEPSRERVMAAGGRRALEAISSASWSGDVLSARAKQALRELA